MSALSHVTIFIAGLVLVLLAPSARIRAETRSDAAASGVTILSGRVVFQGRVPPEAWVPVHKHRELCGEQRPLARHRVSQAGGVENVAVILEGETQTFQTPAYEQPVAVLDNRECEFLPRVQVVPPLAVLEVRNSDPILHSAHAYVDDGETAFHVALPHFRDWTRTQLPRAGLLRIECDVGHSWMRAYILISSSPFTAVTGREGTFEFRRISPGRYRLRAWHEAFGLMERKVNVGKGEHVSLNLVFGPGNAQSK